MSVNQWVYAAFVLNASGSALSYKNGVLMTTSTPSPSNFNRWLYPNSYLNVGSSGYYGSIGSFRMYNRALSASEIQQNFNSLRGRYGI